MKIEKTSQRFNNGYHLDLASLLYSVHQNQWVDRDDTENDEEFCNIILNPLVDEGCKIKMTRRTKTDNTSTYNLIIAYETAMGKQKLTSSVLCTRPSNRKDKEILLRKAVDGVVDYVYKALSSEMAFFDWVDGI